MARGRGRRRRGRGRLVTILILAACLLGVFLFVRPILFTIPGTVVAPIPNPQPQTPAPPSLYDEIHAQYGNKYDGYENLIHRTGSGGLDTRDADAALAGQTVVVPERTVLVLETTPKYIALPSGTGTEEIETSIFRYTNAERQKYGLPPLALNTCLQEIARAHSGDMTANNYFSHVNLRGQDPSARAAGHGCPTEKSLGGGTYRAGIGENIGLMPTGNVAGYGYVSNTPSVIARTQVDSWMSSPGHRQNILDPSYSSVGVGTARDASGTYISTQDFW